jgi:hypothetical protein
MAWNLSALFRPTTPAARHTRRPAPRPTLEALEGRYAPAFGVTFAVDPTASFATVSGDVGGNQIHEQGPGSLTTTYEGTVHTSLADDESSIQFLTDTTNLTADNSGSWQPRAGGSSGSEPANYGAQATIIIVTARVAIRDLALNVSSGVLSIPDGATFDSSQQTLQTTAGSADYNAGVFGSGRASIAGLSTANQATPGSFSDNGDGTFNVFFPIHFTVTGTIQGMVYHLTADGQISGLGAADSPSPSGQGHASQAFLVGSQALTGTVPASVTAPTGRTDGPDANAQALPVDAAAGLAGPTALSLDVPPTATSGHALTITGATDHAIPSAVSDGLHTALVADAAASLLAPA